MCHKHLLSPAIWFIIRIKFAFCTSIKKLTSTYHFIFHILFHLHFSILIKSFCCFCYGMGSKKPFIEHLSEIYQGMLICILAALDLYPWNYSKELFNRKFYTALDRLLVKIYSAMIAKDNILNYFPPIHSINYVTSFYAYLLFSSKWETCMPSRKELRCHFSLQQENEDIPNR